MPTDLHNVPAETSPLKDVPFYKTILTKIVLSFLFLIVLSGGSFFALNQNFSQKSNQQVMQEEVNTAEGVFRNLLESDTKTLSATLAVVAKEPVTRKIYEEKDREKLYDYTSPLFNELKEKYGITHWYFILPDGHVFLRVHQKEIYGDDVKRFTFLKARDTQKVASGLELGKTAYALRAVMPYHDEEGKLIGYVELGEEIDHLFKILKRETADEFALIADKKYLNREDWHSAMTIAGKEDTWDKIGGEHLLLISTLDSTSSVACFTEDNLEEVEEGEHLFDRIKEDGNVYQCGGFPFDDAGGRHSGSVLALLDISTHSAILSQAQRTTALLLLALIAVFMLIGWFLAHYLVRPINRLSRIAQVVAAGDLDVRADIRTGDEIELLAQNFNKMTDTLVEVRKYPEGIIRSMADSLILVDNNGIIKEINHATLALLGYEKNELLGSPMEKIILVPIAETDSSFLKKMGLEKTVLEGGVCNIDTSFKTKDGTEIAMSISCSIMKGESGEVFGVVFVGKDVRAAREEEEKLKLSGYQLRIANQELEASQNQLQTKLSELERFNKAVVGRELKMAELKKENEELKLMLEGEGKK